MFDLISLVQTQTSMKILNWEFNIKLYEQHKTEMLYINSHQLQKFTTQMLQLYRVSSNFECNFELKFIQYRKCIYVSRMHIKRLILSLSLFH